MGKDLIYKPTILFKHLFLGSTIHLYMILYFFWMFQFVSFNCLTNILLFWTFLCPVRKVYTDSMFNISKTFKKKTNIIERKKEANTLKAVWIFYCLKANRCGLTNILNLYLLNSCCYMLYSCPCRYYIEKKIWVWLEKNRERSRSVPLYLERVSGQIFYLCQVFPPKCHTNSIS